MTEEREESKRRKRDLKQRNGDSRKELKKKFKETKRHSARFYEQTDFFKPLIQNKRRVLIYILSFTS